MNTKALHYPDDWQTLTREIKQAVDYICQECQIQCRRPGELFDTHKRTLTVAHYDGEYDAPEIFVVALCSRCHMLHDAPMSWKARRRHLRLRRQMAGQLEIFTA